MVEIPVMNIIKASAGSSRNHRDQQKDSQSYDNKEMSFPYQRNQEKKTWETLY